MRTPDPTTVSFTNNGKWHKFTKNSGGDTRVVVNPSGTPRLEISRNNNSNLCGGEANDTVTRDDDEVVYLSGCETGAGIIELRREADNSLVRT